MSGRLLQRTLRTALTTTIRPSTQGMQSKTAAISCRSISSQFTSPNHAVDSRYEEANNYVDGCGEWGQDGHRAHEGDEDALSGEERCEGCKSVRRKGGKKRPGVVYIICSLNPKHKARQGK